MNTVTEYSINKCLTILMIGWDLNCIKNLAASIKGNCLFLDLYNFEMDTAGHFKV